MKISVRVKPNARKNQVSLEADGSYFVTVAAPAVGGKANERLVEVLAEHFNKRKREITIVGGSKGRHKTVEISGL